MLSFSPLLLLLSVQWCSAQYNASTLTASGAADAAVSRIAASFFPSSIQPSLAVAIEQASVPGNINSLVTSFITAASPPPFVTNTALAPYSSRIAKAESMISSLRAAVSGVEYSATHTTVYTVETLTAANGSTFATRVPAQNVSGSAMSSGATAGATAMTTSASGTLPASSTPASSGLAMPTHVPASVAAVVGLLGALAAL